MPDRSCIFCQIVRGERPCFKVYEDEQTLAFLDVYPLAVGHTLVIPKAHRVRFTDLEVDEGRALFKALRDLVGAIERGVKAPACTIGVNDGYESGQVVPHVHIHIVPRFQGDGGGTIHSIMRRRPDVDRGLMEAIAERIHGELHTHISP